MYDILKLRSIYKLKEVVILMDRFKIGDVAYHRAGNKLLGTICGIKEDRVVVRRIEILNEIEMYPAELKTEVEVRNEYSTVLAEAYEANKQIRFDPYD
jgi:hypothetical protein